MGRLKSFEIIFDENRTVYAPGGRVKGKCVLQLRGKMKMRTISLIMKGVAKVHWTESRVAGNGLGAYTHHQHHAQVDYFTKRLTIVGSHGKFHQFSFKPHKHQDIFKATRWLGWNNVRSMLENRLVKSWPCQIEEGLYNCDAEDALMGHE